MKFLNRSISLYRDLSKFNAQRQPLKTESFMSFIVRRLLAIAFTALMKRIFREPFYDNETALFLRGKLFRDASL